LEKDRAQARVFVRSPTRRLTQAPPEERFALKVLILFAPLTIYVSDVLNKFLSACFAFASWFQKFIIYVVTASG
jgi:hypothetical protein